MDEWMDRCTEGWMGNNNKHFYIISHSVANEYASSYRAHLYTKKVNIIKAQTNFHVLLTVFPLMISLSQMFISMSVTWQNFYTLLHNSISIKNNAAHNISFSSWNVMIFVYWFLQMTLITLLLHTAFQWMLKWIPRCLLSGGVLTAHGGPWDQCTVAWENLTLTDGHYVLEPRDISFNKRV